MTSTTHKTLHILNGPNLNRLGTREPAIYGTTTLADIEAQCREAASPHAIVFRQTNSEAQLIDWIHEAIDDEASGIVINPAAYSFTSLAILDALKMFPGPIIELHISNIHARDELHRHSKVSSSAKAVICGAGPYGYILAMQAAAHMLDALPSGMRAVF